MSSEACVDLLTYGIGACVFLEQNEQGCMEPRYGKKGPFPRKHLQSLPKHNLCNYPQQHQSSMSSLALHIQNLVVSDVLKNFNSGEGDRFRKRIGACRPAPLGVLARARAAFALASTHKRRHG